MDETMNEVIEEPVLDDVVAVDDVDAMSEAEAAMWDSDDESSINEESNPSANEADQLSEEEGSMTEPEAQAEDADQYLELKHFDEVKKVGKAEAKELAQKGMDYDRVRGKLAEANAALEQAKAYKEFLEELKGDFDSIEDLMDDTRARVNADKNGTSYEEEVGKIKGAKQAKQQAAQQPVMDAEYMRKASLDQFLQEYPNVKAADIPQEVWDDMKRTNNLSLSYSKWQYKQLSSEAEVLRQNQKNKSRSTGSMSSTGAGKQMTWEDKLWYTDDY